MVYLVFIAREENGVLNIYTNVSKEPLKPASLRRPLEVRYPRVLSYSPFSSSRDLVRCRPPLPGFPSEAVPMRNFVELGFELPSVMVH
jgi:hypothetical protein